MHIRDLLLPVAIIAMITASCGEGPQGPVEVVEAMFTAAQDGDYDTMMEYMSPEVQNEINVAALSGMEIVSWSVDEVEMSPDSTRVDVEFTITIRNISTGETEVEDDEIELMKTASGEWYIVDM